MSERDSKESEHVGLAYDNTFRSNSQSQVIPEHAQYYHYRQARPIYSYNMHHYYLTSPINQITNIKQLPWEPATSYNSNIGGLCCSAGVPGTSKVYRPTPLYMAHSQWSMLAQGAASSTYTSQGPSTSYITSQSNRKSSDQEMQIYNKPSVIKHASDVARSSNTTINKISPKSQACQKKLPSSNERTTEHFDNPTTRKKECASTDSIDETDDVAIAVNIKEEKVDSPADSPCLSTPRSSYNHHDYQQTTSEDNSPEDGNEPEAMHFSQGMVYSSMYPLNYGTESAFQKPEKTSSSVYPYIQDNASAFQKPEQFLPPVYPVCYSEDESASVFQNPSSPMYPLQYGVDTKSAFQQIQNPSTSTKSLMPVNDHYDTEQGPSGLSHGSSGSSDAAASYSKKPKTSKHVCDECGRSFTRSSTLVTHKRIHTGEKPFECEICGRAFRQPGNLSRHRLTHTTSKPYVCPHCNKAFNRASNLHTHMRTHSDYKPYECEFCDKRFHQKVDMKIHRYTHTGEKPHQCPKCGRGFKQLTHLTYHLRTHSDVRMYHCEFCGKGFNQKGNLQAHRYRHTGERPFKCDVCGKGFTLASTRNTHLRTHATKKPFECQYCDKSFYQKNALKTHYIASHPYTDGVLIL